MNTDENIHTRVRSRGRGGSYQHSMHATKWTYHTYTHAYIHTRISHLHIGTVSDLTRMQHTNMYTHAYKHIRTCTHTYTHITRAHTNTYTHAYMHTHTSHLRRFGIGSYTYSTQTYMHTQQTHTTNTHVYTHSGGTIHTNTYTHACIPTHHTCIGTVSCLARMQHRRT
jgi:hypothetical protein